MVMYATIAIKQTVITAKLIAAVLEMTVIEINISINRQIDMEI